MNDEKKQFSSIGEDLKKTIEKILERTQWNAILMTSRKPFNVKKLKEQTDLIRIAKVHPPNVPSSEIFYLTSLVERDMLKKIDLYVDDDSDLKEEKVQLLENLADKCSHAESTHNFRNRVRFAFDFRWKIEETEKDKYTKRRNKPGYAPVPFGTFVLTEKQLNYIYSELELRIHLFAWLKEKLYMAINVIASRDVTGPFVVWDGDGRELKIAEFLMALRYTGIMTFVDEPSRLYVLKQLTRLFNLKTPNWPKLEQKVRERGPAFLTKLTESIR